MTAGAPVRARRRNRALVAPQPDVPAARGVRVLLVDAEAPLPELSAGRTDGTRWAGVWLAVRVAGDPVGIVELPFDDRDVLPTEEVRAAVDAVAASARVRELPALPDAALPSVTVVVPTDLSRPEQLRACVVGLVALDHPQFEVVVVDNHRGSDRDGLVDQVLAGLPGVRTVREPVPGISAARNAGVDAARGEVIAFTDDDVRVDPGWLRALSTRFALRPDEELVSGLILPDHLETDAQLWFERHYGGFGGSRSFQPLTYRGAGATAHPALRSQVTCEDWNGTVQRSLPVYGAGICGAGANFAVRAETLRRLGGFDVSLGTGTPARGGEDLALFIGQLWSGGAIGFEPAGIVFHTHRADYAGLRTQLFNYGLGFTALLTALVVGDPRHLVGVAARLPGYVRGVQSTSSDVVAGAAPLLGPPPPAELATLERRGMLRGPAAYLRSRLGRRRRAAVAR